MLRPSTTPSDSTRVRAATPCTPPSNCCGRAHQIDMHAGHRQAARRGKIVAHRAEIGGQHDLHRRLGQRRIGRASSAARAASSRSRHQHRLVDLHPLRARLRQRRQIRRDRPAAVWAAAPSGREPSRIFASLQERHRPDQHGPRGDAQKFRFLIFVQRLAAGRARIPYPPSVPARCSDNWCRTIWSFPSRARLARPRAMAKYRSSGTAPPSWPKRGGTAPSMAMVSSIWS